MILLAIIGALLPVALLFYYIQKKDKDKPEPRKQLLKAVFFGVLSVVVAVIAARAISKFNVFQTALFSSFFSAFFEAAIPEEGAKFLMLWLLLRRNPYFDEHLDGIVYATCIGLGFAGVENIMYLLQNLDNLAFTAITRGLLSVPGHFFFAVAMGYFYSLARFSSRTEKERRGYMLCAYFIPVIFHGIYDFLLLLSDAIPAISSILVIVFLYFINKLFKAGRRRIAEMKKNDEREMLNSINVE